MNRIFSLLFVFVTTMIWAQTKIFVSQQAGSDSNSGADWQNSLKTLDAAMDKATSTGVYDIYIAEGTYTANNTRVVSGTGVKVNVYGGFPTPSKYTTTLPDPCNASGADYKTVITKPVSSGPVFEVKDSNNALNFRDMTFENLEGRVLGASLITIWAGATNTNIGLDNVAIKNYVASTYGVIYDDSATGTTVTIKNTLIDGGNPLTTEGGGVFGTAAGSKNVTLNVLDSEFNNIHTQGLRTDVTAIFALHQNSHSNSRVLMQGNKMCTNTHLLASNNASGVLSTTYVESITLKDNYFTGYQGGLAGAVYVEHSVSFVSENNVYQNNTGYDGGGAVHIEGSVPSDVSANPTIYFKNDKFYGNSVKIGFGTAVKVNLAASVYITDTAFNTSDGVDGGALYIDNGSFPVEVTNSIFCNNKLSTSAFSFGGGAIMYEGKGKLTVNKSAFRGNSVSGGQKGGAIYISGGELVVNNSYFEGNSGSSSGGAIYTNVPITLIGNFFENNSASDGGALQYSGANSSNIIISANNKYYKNKATNGSGGAINFYNTLSNKSTLQLGNTVNGGDTFIENTATANGGAISLFDSTYQDFIVRNTTFYANQANNGGAISISGTSGRTSGTEFSIYSSQFYSNAATSQGGAISAYDSLIDGNNEITRIDGSTFYGNTVGGSATDTDRRRRSDIFLQTDAIGIRYANIQSITNSYLQFTPNTTIYPSASYGLGAGNNISTAPDSYPSYTAPTTEVPNCGDGVPDSICGTNPLLGSAIWVSDAVNTTPTDGLATCEPIVTFSANAGKPVVTFSYHYKVYSNLADALAGVNGVQSNPLTISTTATNSQVSITVPETGKVFEKGKVYVFYLDSYADSTGNSESYTCTVLRALVDITNCAKCTAPADTTTAGIDVKHGITSLQRAGTDNGNWPMVRKSAYTVLEAKTKGFVITRSASPETDITNPVKGMMVWDTAKNCLRINTDGTTAGWKCFNNNPCGNN